MATPAFRLRTAWAEAPDAAQPDLSRLDELAAATIVTSTTPPFIITHVNAAWERLCGYTAREAVGSTCTILQGRLTDPAKLATLRQASEHLKPITVELVNYRKDGSSFLNELSVRPLRGPTGVVSHLVGTLVARQLEIPPVARQLETPPEASALQLAAAALPLPPPPPPPLLPPPPMPLSTRAASAHGGGAEAKSALRRRAAPAHAAHASARAAAVAIGGSGGPAGQAAGHVGFAKPLVDLLEYDSRAPTLSRVRGRSVDGVAVGAGALGGALLPAPNPHAARRERHTKPVLGGSGADVRAESRQPQPQPQRQQRQQHEARHAHAKGSRTPPGSVEGSFSSAHGGGCADGSSFSSATDGGSFGGSYGGAHRHAAAGLGGGGGGILRRVHAVRGAKHQPPERGAAAADASLSSASGSDGGGRAAVPELSLPLLAAIGAQLAGADLLCFRLAGRRFREASVATAGGPARREELLSSKARARWARRALGLEPSAVPGACALACARGDLELLRWLHKHGAAVGAACCDAAAEHGHAAVLHWLLRHGCAPEPGGAALHAAAARGHLGVLREMQSRGLCPPDEELCFVAAESGQMGVLRWAREEAGCAWSEMTAAAAAGAGHLGVLEQLLDGGCPVDEQAAIEAARGGHGALLRWAHERGCPLGEDTCMALASVGALAELKWARRAGVPWATTTVTAAAANGHVGALRWALDNGCDAEALTVRAAAAAEGGGTAALECIAAHPSSSRKVRALATSVLLERRSCAPAAAPHPSEPSKPMTAHWPSAGPSAMAISQHAGRGPGGG